MSGPEEGGDPGSSHLCVQVPDVDAARCSTASVCLSLLPTEDDSAGRALPSAGACGPVGSVVPTGKARPPSEPGAQGPVGAQRDGTPGASHGQVRLALPAPLTGRRDRPGPRRGPLSILSQGRFRAATKHDRRGSPRPEFVLAALRSPESTVRARVSDHTRGPSSKRSARTPSPGLVGHTAPLGRGRPQTPGTAPKSTPAGAAPPQPRPRRPPARSSHPPAPPEGN